MSRDYYLLNNSGMQQYLKDLDNIKQIIEGVDENEKDD